ncbi:hypothetical protein Bbelb_328190 [Branchiostoma belcheri]|nr:hypothetical protein Bbelb_328190 [Branchiostoma belcheri]
MAAEVAPARTALSTRSKSDTSVNGSDRRDSVKSDTSSSMGSRRAPRPPIDRTARRRSVAVMDLGTQARKPGQAFKSTLGGSLLASRRGTAAFRSMFLPKLDAEPEEPKIPGPHFTKTALLLRSLCDLKSAGARRERREIAKIAVFGILITAETVVRSHGAHCALTIGSPLSALSRRRYDPVQNSRRGDGAHGAPTAISLRSGQYQVAERAR